ncbi:MAG: YraN family protein [Patescibacteria group bacterium]|nr:YraN family protein [Patescibacteria group bacterium]
MNKRVTGLLAETHVANYLAQKGYKILNRNYRTRFGEIDIIAKHADTLVFIEVKYRSTIKYGHPEDAVNKRKLKTIQKVAEQYIVSQNKNQNLPKKYRLEIVSIVRINEKFETKIIKII